MPVKQLSDKNPDGVSIGQSADLVSLYGVTPVARAASITALTTTPTATDVGTAVNAIITALKNIGLTS